MSPTGKGLCCELEVTRLCSSSEGVQPDVVGVRRAARLLTVGAQHGVRRAVRRLALLRAGQLLPARQLQLPRSVRLRYSA